MIQHENLFSKLKKTRKHGTFANSYWLDDVNHLPPRLQSVTTVMTLAAIGHVRSKAELLAGKAVNHDITRWTMHTRGYDGELIPPEQAAEHLLNVAETNDVTLFEHFLTDRAGHSGDPEKAFECLDILERFLPRVAAFSEQPNHLFLLCSDHGNIEDLSTKTHTKNPVPLIALGEGAEHFQSLKSLTDVTPAILRLHAT
jgi:2,3-bisphosphoglycerate-independent phosphoglycerate mutase